MIRSLCWTAVFGWLFAIGCAGRFEVVPSEVGGGGNAGSGNTGGSTGGGTNSGGLPGTGGRTSGFAACSVNSDCIVRPASCCGTCGAASRGDSVAINRVYQSDYLKLNSCSTTACPGCYSGSDPTLVATCNNGYCNIVDLLAQPVTACADSTSCRLRTVECCECGGRTDTESLIAINALKALEFSPLVCDPGASCDLCEPIYPATAHAVCSSGHCTVQWM